MPIAITFFMVSKFYGMMLINLCLCNQNKKEDANKKKHSLILFLQVVKTVLLGFYKSLYDTSVMHRQ